MSGAPVDVRDLVALVADKDAEHALRGILQRPDALGIRPITFDIFVHPEHDPGCFRHGAEILRAQQRRFNHALVMFDHHGCGQERLNRTEIENRVELRLRESGWNDRAAVVCLTPELESWVWSDSPHVAAVLGWGSHEPDLRSWLGDKNLWDRGGLKPADPKKAMKEVLYKVNKSWSAAIFQQLAERVSFNRCSDPSFQRLRQVLQSWFPRSESHR